MIGSVVVAAAGCAEDGKDAGIPELGPVSVITEPSQVVRLTDAYQLSDAERRALGVVVDIVFADCIRSYGVEYLPVQDSPCAPGPWDVEPKATGSYGLFDPLETWYDGYRPRYYPPEVTSPPAARPPDDMWRLSTGTTDGFTRLAEFAGRPVPEGGCTQVRSDAYFAQGIEIGPTLASASPSADPRIDTAEKAWSTCMKQKGFDYPDPKVAQSQDRWSKGPDDPVSEEERATARADNRCKLDTNLVGIVNAVEVAYEKRWIEQNAQLLAENRVRRDDLLRRAAGL